MTGRTLTKVQTALTEIESAGNLKGTLSAVQLDVTDDASIAQAVQHVEKHHGRLDALINNAAIGRMDPDVRTRVSTSMETNVVGPAVVAEAFRPLLMKAQKPYGVYVSSGVGSMMKATEPGPRLPNENAYRASKAALNMVAVVENRDFGPQGLRVFTMCPGFVVSNLRGTSEEARSGWGKAGDPLESGKLVLSILEGERDADVGKLVQKDGVYPW